MHKVLKNLIEKCLNCGVNNILWLSKKKNPKNMREKCGIGNF